MPDAAKKDMIREIKGSKNRFLAIMVLSALAVAFLSGLIATAPDMKNTGDAYLDEHMLMDAQVLSTLGITEEDVEALAAQPGVAYAVGAYAVDAWAGDSVAKVYSITEELNHLWLMEGRLPEQPWECAVDASMMEELGLSIGQKLPILPGEDNEDCLRYGRFNIVGAVRSPYYLTVERGSASIGAGTVQGYVYLPEGAFDMEVYTIAYLLSEGALELTAFYDEYDDHIEALTDALEPFGEERARLRYEEIIDEAMEEIEDAEQELAEAVAEAEEEIADAEQELADARQELDDGWKEYEKGKRDIEKAYPELMDGEKELWDGWRELVDGEREFEEGLIEFQEGREEYESGKQKLDDSYAALNASQQDMDAATGLMGMTVARGESFTAEQAAAAISGAMSEVTAQLTALEAQITKLRGIITDLELQIAGLEGQLSGMDSSTDEYAEKAAALVQAEADKAEAVAGLSEAQAGQAGLQAKQGALSSLKAAELAAGSVQLAEGWTEYDKGRAELDSAKAQLDDAEEEIRDGRWELDEGWREYYDGRQELDEGWQEYYDGKAELPKALEELEDGEAEYADGLAELEEAKLEFEQEIADAEEELADARREVADIETGEWHILPRGYNPGYTGFGQDADRMANLADVFPVIFFLVAGLVCLTTMTRMVDEQRTQIGLMKALGAGFWTISAKYLSYGLLPSLAGGVLGLVIGHLLFPTMIYVSYQIMYEMPDIILSFHPWVSLWAVLAAVGCTTLSTLWACMATLSDSPANLMRPRAPKPGRRVLLERIPAIWRRLSFNWKITVRNLLRYQKRFWMTVMGIGGCAALIIAALGLKESLTMTMDKQYGELFRYDAQLTLSEGLLEEERAEVMELLEASEDISGYAPLYAAGVTAQTDAYSVSAYMEVFRPQDVDKFIVLRDYDFGAAMALPDSGVLINKKLSELLKAGPGDTITIDSDGMYEATVAGVYEHYVAHFIYMSPTAYEEIFGAGAEENSVLLNLAEDSQEAADRALSELLGLNGVSAATRAKDTRDTYLNSMERIDFVVVVVILCAAALAVVVLYNLSNINIAERKRELATIKVLGFYDLEVTAYVYRENMLLTIVGILLGCFFGKYLHTWLIKTVEIDLMMFGRSITAGSYAMAAVLTLLFSGAVNAIAHRQMKAVDMVESLKSAE